MALTGRAFMLAGDDTKMRIKELNHVAIHVEDVERSCSFYRTVLRLESIPRPAFDFPGAWFQLGDVQELHIIGGASPREESGKPLRIVGGRFRGVASTLARNRHPFPSTQIPPRRCPADISAGSRRPLH